jgi:hypothetical protein
MSARVPQQRNRSQRCVVARTAGTASQRHSAPQGGGLTCAATWFTKALLGATKTTIPSGSSGRATTELMQ